MKHLLGIEELSSEQIENIINKAVYYSKALKDGSWDREKLKNKIILTMFFENSTRTVTSFNFAAKRLGAGVINWNASVSSLSKNESFTDTIDTLGSMKPDAIVIRHKEYGAPITVSERVDCPVVNAGDSWREHPTQALLDALTVIQEKSKIKGLNIAICGDVAHSRVANSDAHLFTKLGANVRFVAPKSLMPEKLPTNSVSCFDSLEEGIKDCDVVVMLRIQKERMEMNDIPDDDAYFKSYGLTYERLKSAKPDTIILHPGPVNRGIEIADDLASDPRYSRLTTQVANGVPTRMAVLDMLLSE